MLQLPCLRCSRDYLMAVCDEAARRNEVLAGKVPRSWVVRCPVAYSACDHWEAFPMRAPCAVSNALHPMPLLFVGQQVWPLSCLTSASCTWLLQAPLLCHICLTWLLLAVCCIMQYGITPLTLVNVCCSLRRGPPRTAGRRCGTGRFATAGSIRPLWGLKF